MAENSDLGFPVYIPGKPKDKLKILYHGNLT